MKTTKQKQTRRNRELTSGYQGRGSVVGAGKIGSMGLEAQAMMCKIDRQQDIPYRAGIAASYFIITLGV